MTGAPLLMEAEERESEVEPQIKTSASVEEEEMKQRMGDSGETEKEKKKAHDIKDDHHPTLIRFHPHSTFPEPTPANTGPLHAPSDR